VLHLASTIIAVTLTHRCPVAEHDDGIYQYGYGTRGTVNREAGRRRAVGPSWASFDRSMHDNDNDGNMHSPLVKGRRRHCGMGTDLRPFATATSGGSRGDLFANR